MFLISACEKYNSAARNFWILTYFDRPPSKKDNNVAKYLLLKAGHPALLN